MASLRKDAVEKLRAQIETAQQQAMDRAKVRASDDLAALAGRCEAHKLGVNENGWGNPYPSDDPRSLLLEYQYGYFHDRSRFKCGLFSRQTGKDFSSEGEAAEDCNVRKTEWMIAGPSERQALDSLEQGKTWAEAFDLKVNDYQERREGGSETLLKSAEIIFSNGSRMRAVPGMPNTVRGRSANILLTEFDFFEQPTLTWRAMLPSITNPLRGGEKKVRLITTPNGIGGGMHAIWTKPDGKMKWSRHLVTIYHAVLMGLPVDIAELREAFGDPDGWAQEFECQFLDAASVLLPYELIAACENSMATMGLGPEFWQTSRANMAPLYGGLDFGRKKNLSVLWALEDIAGFKLTKEVLEMANMSTPDQVRLVRPRIQQMQRVSVDYTGPGIGMGDLLVEEFGEWNPEQHKFGKIELCTFSQQFKCDIFPKLRMEFENRRLGIPISKVVREDLHTMNRVVSATGGVTYRAPQIDDGHADRCTALALAARAASWQVMAGNIHVFGGTRRSQVLSSRRERSIAG